ncbi:HD domain-containing protein [Hominifimenecus sp. rT4P-3]|uniref:HD domain-containing protein n=1 Tax=Hominifimenecus sp. rT4P-3 TaxID=3242979 RepID=UPI003DA49BFC
MERVNRIWNHPQYQENFRLLLSMEADRKFCRHGLPHCLDVARLTCLYEWEAGRRPEKELIYAAALLHDLGRGREYRDQVPHEQASIEQAEKILPDCGYSTEEQKQILEWIGSHRGRQKRDGTAASFYRADKESRNCFACPAESECHWADEKKNKGILG